MEKLVESLDLEELEYFVKSGIWKGKESLVGAIFSRFCSLTNRVYKESFGNQDFWNAVIGTESLDDGIAVQPTGVVDINSSQDSTTFQSTAAVPSQDSLEHPTNIQPTGVVDITSPDSTPSSSSSSSSSGSTSSSGSSSRTSSSASISSSSGSSSSSSSSSSTSDSSNKSSQGSTIVQATAAAGTPSCLVPYSDTESEEEEIQEGGNQAELDHFFVSNLESRIRNRRFQTDRLRFSVAPRNFEEIQDWSTVLDGILKECFRQACEVCNPRDLVQVELRHPCLKKGPSIISFKEVGVFKVEEIIKLLEKLIQSGLKITFDEKLEIGFVIVHQPVGSAPAEKRKYRNNFEGWMESHRRGCFIQIKNKDRLCCARAIVVAKAKAEKDPKWESIRKDESGRCNVQKNLATKLMKDAGLENHKESCGIEEFQKLQAVLSPGFQLKIFSKDAYNAVIFRGPQAPVILSLFHHDAHFDVITSVAAFFDDSYYCHHCDHAYRNPNGHLCQATCPSCFGDVHEDGANERIRCPDCGRYFFNQECFEKHKEVGKGNAAKKQRMETSTCTRVRRCLDCGIIYIARVGKHVCDTKWCSTCKARVDRRDHQCYMQPFKIPPKPAFNTFIYFDFETSQTKDQKDDDFLTHKVNACVAQKVCLNCRYQDFEEECGFCGEKEKVFVKEGALEEFCEWLYRPENAKSLVMAHNSQGFDGQFILNYLEKQSVKPEVILNGQKILSLESNGVKIVDSYSFLPMPLSQFPKAFNLKELKKGYFPHLFNVEANWDFEGKIPDVKFFDPDHMKPQPRVAFLRWYQDQVEKEESWNFEDELIAYCKSDVDILRRGCIEFQRTFTEQTGVDPFQNAITIAQACQKVFRASHLAPNKIALLSHGGLRQKDRFSATAIKWLRWESQERGVWIRHALNGGEVKIGNWKVDGLIEGTNVVLEFHGCSFHGCPECYRNRDLRLPLANRTAEEAYLATMDRTKALTDLGYQVEEKWGCELNRELRDNKRMTDFFKTQQIIEPLNPREALFGGRTNATNLRYEAKEGEKIHYEDVCSLYPWVCKTGKFPVGHPKVITEGFEPIESRPYEGIIKAKVLPPRRLLHPPLPFKSQGKLCFPLCRSCVDDREQGDCEHSNEERSFIGSWVTDELYKALDTGYKVIQVYEVYHFEETMCYDGKDTSTGLFASFMDTFIKLKTEASGWPAWVQSEEDKARYIDEFSQKEGIKLDPEKIEKNPAARQLAKLMLNSFWGKFAQNPNLGSTLYFTDPAPYFATVFNPVNEISTIRCISENLAMVTLKLEDDFVGVTPNLNVVLAAYVTAQARLKLYSFIEPLQDRILYFDTDSIIYVTRAVDSFKLPTGSFLGELTNELEGFGKEAYIVQFVSGGPKNYGYRVLNPSTGETKEEVKVKGFTINHATAAKLNFRTLESKVVEFLSSGSRSETSIEQKKIGRKEGHIVITENMKKGYRVTYDKRKVNSDGTTLPFGY